MRLAFLADIHSNLPALEAVRDDLFLMAPDQVFLGGDQINRCPWPNEVMELVADMGWPMILGNHEIIVSQLAASNYLPIFDDRGRFADLWWTCEVLTPQNYARIEALPSEREIVLDGAPPILLVHGLRGDAFDGIYPTMQSGQIAERIRNVDVPTLVTAHTHWPLQRDVDGRQVLNPGSVGMAYNGDPRAQYLLLDLVDGKWVPTFRQVEYDHAVVRAAFDELGLFQAYGPMGPLYWQTIETGDPWVSDFLIWVRDQAPIVQENLERAVELYLSVHGPGKWAFVHA